MAFIATILGVTGLVSSMTLNRLATELRDLQYSLDRVSDVKSDHIAWRQELTESVLTGKKFTGSLDPDECMLGIWYHSNQAQGIEDPLLLWKLEELESPHTFLYKEARAVLTFLEEGNQDAAKKHLQNYIFPKSAEVISVLTSIQVLYSNMIEANYAVRSSIANTIKIANTALIVVAVALCLFFALHISKSISKPLIALSSFMRKAGSTGDITLTPLDIETINKHSRTKDELGQAVCGSAAFIRHVTNIAKELEYVASGDLSSNVKLLSENDTMGKSMKQMLNSLNNMFAEIHLSTEQVLTGAKQIADGAEILANGSAEQASSIEIQSCSLAMIAEGTKENTALADKTAKLFELIKDNAEKGSSRMDQMIEAVTEINEAGNNIIRITKAINDIAFQTKILALNASIEAAHAGQHGKGFSIVAEEVRKLAARSAEAAKDTGEMIRNSIIKAELGYRIAGETADSLKEIVSGISESSKMIDDIARSSVEQSSGVGFINTEIDQVSQTVQQNCATAQESAAVCRQMSEHSGMLQQLIAQFKIIGQEGILKDMPLIENTEPRQLDTVYASRASQLACCGEFVNYK